ncbi:MAG TPA: TIGR03619 family F420-dependent LLM class oxidoreductase [Acidimicrobiales bacterium]|nr:TIGR03619 family F420-dependent LLM class oxidoreductase [Acidimicrobiales bacterium]
MALRVGIQTPILVQTPRGHAGWEETAGPDELRHLVQAADRFGYHHVTCSEHVMVPASEAGRRGAVYWDPVATLAWVAALTERIRLATNVVVLGYHHPVALAKRYGTLDRLSAGRLILGVGVGSMEEEFSLLGAPFDDRGPRADDTLRALRACWGRPDVIYDGPYHRFGPFTVEPHGVQPHLPVWVGGYTRRSLARAVELADGWTPFALRLPAVRELLAAFELPEGFDVVLGPPRPLDPTGDPDGTRRTLADMEAAGATAVHAGFVHHSVEHYLEQLEAMAALIRP